MRLEGCARRFVIGEYLGTRSESRGRVARERTDGEQSIAAAARVLADLPM